MVCAKVVRLADIERHWQEEYSSMFTVVRASSHLVRQFVIDRDSPVKQPMQITLKPNVAYTSRNEATVGNKTVDVIYAETDPVVQRLKVVRERTRQMSTQQA